jgi:hypothetical protein
MSVRSAPARQIPADGRSNMTLTDQGTDPIPHFTRTRLVGCLAAATAALAVMAPLAQAGDTPPQKAAQGDNALRGLETAGNVENEGGALAPAKPAATPPCADRTLTKVFSAWHDNALYTLAGGGDFETQAAGWTLEGPASIAADSSPFLLGPALGASSLELAAGAVAVSPPICVERGFKSFRLVARSVSADQGVVRVRVRYANGKTKKLARRVRPGTEWAPTRKLSLAQGLFHVRRHGSTEIQLRFAASAGTVRVDDVYVDPFYRR